MCCLRALSGLAASRPTSLGERRFPVALQRNPLHSLMLCSGAKLLTILRMHSAESCGCGPFSTLAHATSAYSATPTTPVQQRTSVQETVTFRSQRQDCCCSWQHNAYHRRHSTLIRTVMPVWQVLESTSTPLPRRTALPAAVSRQGCDTAALPAVPAVRPCRN